MQATKVSPTPGPWAVYKTPNKWNVVVHFPDAGIEELEANARVIAAATELLEACLAAEENLSPKYSSDHLVMQKLRAAIRHAQGE